MAEYMHHTRETAPDSKDRIIMVIDSNANDLFYTTILLQRLGYRVCSAKAVDEALELMSAALPAVIIAELGYPQQEYITLFQQLKQDQRTESIPLIVLTLSGDMVAEKRCFEAGAADCLIKPIREAELYRAVQTVMEPKPRGYVRVQTMIPLVVNNVPLDYSEGECATMLSEQGMYVRTLKPAPVNTQVSVSMVIKGRRIARDAEILYNNRLGEGPFGQPGMGLRFTTSTPDDQEAIRQYIHETITSDIAPNKR